MQSAREVAPASGVPILRSASGRARPTRGVIGAVSSAAFSATTAAATHASTSGRPAVTPAPSATTKGASASSIVLSPSSHLPSRWMASCPARSAATTSVATDVVAALRAGQDAIQRLGKCELGDKTMLDALAPFVVALGAGVTAGRPLVDAWVAAAVVAEKAAEDTAPMTPRVGRARPLAERSIGTPDAGATSLALCMTVAGRALAARSTHAED